MFLMSYFCFSLYFNNNNSKTLRLMGATCQNCNTVNN